MSSYGCVKSLGSSKKEATAVYRSAHAHLSDRGIVHSSGRGSDRASVNANGRNGRVLDHGSASGQRLDGGVAGMWAPARRRR